MYEPAIQKKILEIIMTFIIQCTSVGTTADMPDNSVTEMSQIQEISAENLNVSTISVSCLKVTWSAEKGRDYYVSCTAHDEDYAYTDNMYFVFKGNDLCYITGLREGTEYTVTVEPILTDDENGDYSIKSASADGETETVEVIYEFPHEDDWTNAFAGERASGLKAQPALGAIYGSIVDPITGTGIRRDEYGDYCAALGLFYGYAGTAWIWMQISSLSKKSTTVIP